MEGALPDSVQMMGQVAHKLQQDSSLYRFTPVTVRREGGNPVTISAPVASLPVGTSQRQRAQSITGETSHWSAYNPERFHSDLPIGSASRAPGGACPGTAIDGPLEGSSLSANNNTSGNKNNIGSSSSGGGGGGGGGVGGTTMASTTCAGVLINTTMPARPTAAAAAPAVAATIGGMNRCGSADRQHHSSVWHASIGSSLVSVPSSSPCSLTSGSGTMPAIASGGCGSGDRILPPMRHSMSGSPGLGGLPKLELPSLSFTGHSGGGPFDTQVLGPRNRSRRSLSGGIADTALAAATTSFQDAPFPPPPVAGLEGSGPPSPSRSSPAAQLAPLRVSGPMAPATSATPTSSVDSAAGGWCSTGGGGSGSGGLLSLPSSRRYSSSVSVPDSCNLPPTPLGLPGPLGPLLPCASEGFIGVPLTSVPLTTHLPVSGGPCAPPRRSHSLTSDGLGRCSSVVVEEEAVNWSCPSNLTDKPATTAVAAAVGRDAASAAAVGRDAASATAVGRDAASAAKALREIALDLQRKAGALSELQAPAFRCRSSGAAAAYHHDEDDGEVLSSSSPPPRAPLTRSELLAVRESAPKLQRELRVAVRRVFQVFRHEMASVPSGSQMSSSVHECWAALDAFLDRTCEFTNVLVDGALYGEAVAPAAAAVAAAQLQPQPPSQPSQRQQQQRDASTDQRGNGERFREVNRRLLKEVEDLRARLVKAQAEAVTAGAATVAAEAGLRGGAGVLTTVSSGSPRPPPPPVAPLQERYYGASPRRGKHAMSQSSRDDMTAALAAASDSVSCSTGGAAIAVLPQSSVTALAAAIPPAASPPRRFDRTVLERWPSYSEIMIEADDSEEDDVLGDPDTDDGSIDARRRMLTYNSASFAEWVRGVRRR